MKYTIHTKPNARRTAVTERADGSLSVAVTAPATEGKANAAVIKALAAHLNVPPSRIRIVRGLKSKLKICLVN